MNRTATAITALAIALLGTGCATVPTSADIPDIPPGTRVQLSVVIPEWQSPNTLTNTEGVMLLGAGGAAAGAVSGAAVGIGASVICGPAAFFCAAVTVPAGMLTGGIVGLGVGASEGASKGLPKDDAKALESAAEAAQLTHTHPALLASTFKHYADNFWITTTDNTDVKITLAVAPLRIKQEKRGLVRFETAVSALVDYGDGKKPRTYTFPRMTSLRSVNSLLDDDGALTDRSVGEMYEHGIRHVVAGLSDTLTTYEPRGEAAIDAPPQ